MSKSTATYIDTYIGYNIANRRNEMQITHSDLAYTTGISESEIIDFENGDQRAVASKLLLISKALHVKMEYFFTNPINQIMEKSIASDDQALISFLKMPESQSLIRAFIQIDNYEQRLDAIECVKRLSHISKAYE
jgi:transcriptional regulator with XRE-family HTH domain